MSSAERDSHPPEPGSDTVARREPPPLSDEGPPGTAPPAPQLPPSSDSSTLATDAAEARFWHSPWRRLADLSLPWTVSLVLHLLLLVVLAIVFLPRLLESSPTELVLRTATENDLGDATLSLASLTHEVTIDDRREQDFARVEEPVEIESPRSEFELPVPVPVAARPSELGIETLTQPVRGGGGSVAEQLSQRQLRKAGSVAEAIDGLAGEIRADLQQDDVLTVWMFDASISLVEDRQRVAEQLTELFSQLEHHDGKQARLAMNAAAGFGRGVTQLVAPTRFGGRVVEAVKQVPVDDSGQENVFSAIGWAVSRYARRPGKTRLVIWTDESGDDIGALEPTIALCQERGVTVSVVGPSAVLGRQMGTHTYVHPPTGTSHLLPVLKGPDSAMPQRLVMPYWHWPLIPEWAEDLPEQPFGMLTAGMPPWYGGGHLETLTSGFGPYALTRLAAETGGSFTLFDRAGDRGPFDLETMRPYQPDYRDAQAILAELEYQPLRQAVLAATAITGQTNWFGQPQMSFFCVYPLPHYEPGWNAQDAQRRTAFAVFMEPGVFRRRLRAQLQIETQRLEQNAVVIEKALAAFGPDGMEEFFQREQSPRWRAWYDITRGRLLAMSVRHREYMLLAELLNRRKSLHEGTNHVDLLTSDRLRGGSEAEFRALEARRHLARCVTEHRGTPWAYLAQRELDYPMGLDVAQRRLPRPPPRPAVPAAPRSPGGGISLPKL